MVCVIFFEVSSSFQRSTMVRVLLVSTVQVSKRSTMTCTFFEVSTVPVFLKRQWLCNFEVSSP
jgi:hypothetical protein